MLWNRPAFLRILFKSGAWRNSKDRLLLQTLVQIAWAEIPSCKVTNQSNPKHLQITGVLSCFSCGRKAFYLFMRHMSNKCIPRLFTKKCTNESKKSSTVSKYNLKQHLFLTKLSYHLLFPRWWNLMTPNQWTLSSHFSISHESVSAAMNLSVSSFLGVDTDSTR